MAKASGDFGGAQLVEVERALGEGPTQLPRFGPWPNFLAHSHLAPEFIRTRFKFVRNMI